MQLSEASLQELAAIDRAFGLHTRGKFSAGSKPIEASYASSVASTVSVDRIPTPPPLSCRLSLLLTHVLLPSAHAS